uniref:Uncharacterized protein n=1 Tax=Ditylenchus dipsaci TaxID=166011 RepID=A0A915EME5_9BILA
MKVNHDSRVYVMNIEVELRGVTPKFEAKPARFHGLPEEDTAKLKVQEDIAHCSKNQQSDKTENLNLSKAVNPSKPSRRIIMPLMRYKIVHKKAKDSTDQRTSDVVGQNSAIACPAENTKRILEFEEIKGIVTVTYSIADISHDPDSLKIEFETNSYRVRGETTDGNRFEIKRTI